MDENPKHPRASRAGAWRDLLVISLVALVLFLLGTWTNAFEKVHTALRDAGPGREDEVLLALVLTAAGLCVFALLRWRQARWEVAARNAIEDRHRAIVEHMPAVTYTWDPRVPAGTLPPPYVSPQIEEILGVTPEEWKADPELWIRQIHPDDRERVLEASKLSDETGEPFNIEYRHIKDDGVVVWVRDEAVVTERDAEGRPTMVHGVMYDITERKRAEEKLRETEARYRTLVERVPAVTYVWDAAHPTGSVAAPYVSPQIESLLGFSPDEWQSDPTSWHRQVHPEDREAILATWAESDRTGQPFSAEYRIFAKTGDMVWIRDEAVAVSHDNVGRPLFQGVMIDITERKRAEEQLSQAELRYRMLVEQLPAVVYIDAVDEVSTALYVSPRYEQLLGYTAEERMSDPELWLRSIHPEDKAWVQAESKRTNETGDPFMVEYRLIAKDGRVVWIRDEAVIVRDETGAPLYWQGVLLDITQRKRAEERLARRDRILEAVGFAAERFLKTHSWEETISSVLERLGGAAGVSRAYVFENRGLEDGERTTALRFEWTAPGVRPSVNEPNRFRASYRENGFGRWEEVLSAGGAICGPPREFPESERPELAEEDIASIAVVPVFVGDDWWGFLGFDECQNEREWPSAELDALRTAADTLGAAIGRERAARLQAETEARYRSLVEAIPAAVYTEPADDSISTMYMSPQVEAITGYTAERWVDDPDMWPEIIHPDDRERVLSEDKHVAGSEKPFNMEFRIVKPDGSIVWVHDEAVLLRDAQDRPQLWQGFMADITPQKLAEEQLREAETRYRSLVENLPAVTYIDLVDEKSSTAYVSPQVEEILGYTAEEWTTDADLWTRNIHPDDRDRAAEAARHHNRTGDPFDIEYRLRAKDGRWLWIRDEATIVRDAAGHPRFSQGVMFDITERREAEEQLRETEAKYRALVEHIPAVLYVDPADAHGPTMYVSPQAEAVLGIDRERYLTDGDYWLELIHPEDRERIVEAYTVSLERREGWAVEYRIVRPSDGRIIWIRDESMFLPGGEGRPDLLQGVMFDVTERKLAEEALKKSERREREAAERLRALDDMKNTFLAAVSHELRSPLTSILGLSLTLEQQDLTSEDRGDLLSRLASNARKLDRLLKDLLDIDRLNRGIVTPQYRPTDVGALVRRTVDSLDLLADRSVLVEAEPVVVSIDPAKVERIVENLLANAVRHTSADAGIWVRVAPSDGGVLIAVEDDGPGVPEELQKAIFEPFLQGPIASPHSPGTGIGLSLVALFADLHGGRAWVEDRKGGGASFRVFLPGKPTGRNGGSSRDGRTIGSKVRG